MAALIERLKKVKKKPSDWVFVPRRKHHDNCRIMLEDGESVLVSDGNGSFKPQARKKPVTIQVMKVRSVAPDGTVHGGFRPHAIGTGDDAWSEQDVLEEMIEISLNPACEVVPYEAREMGKEAKDAEMNLITERKARLEAEEKLRALEDSSAKDAARLKELEKQLEEITKPGKK